MDPSPPRRERDHRRVAFMVSGVVVIALWPMDFAQTGAWAVDSLFVRLCWGASLLLCGFCADRDEDPTAPFVGTLAASATMLATMALAFQTGGTSSPYFAMLPFLPTLVAQVESEHLHPTIAAALLSIVGCTLIAHFADRGPLFTFAWAASSLFLGWWAIFWLRRSLARRAELLEAERREADAERDRVRALENLAAANQLRAQAERLAAIGKLASGVAHEINNPLAFVRSNLACIEERARAIDDREIAELAEESLEGTVRIEQIVRDLRGFSREPGTDAQRFPVSEAIAEAMRLASGPLRTLRHLDVVVPPDLPQVLCARGRLVQILVNLLVNAADAVAKAEEPRVRITVVAGADALQITVDDNGPGVPPELGDRIFDPFFSTKDAAGMGLGLALSREFAAQIGAHLYLGASELGGACFVIELPGAVASAHAA